MTDYRAAKRTGRVLVVDLYAAAVLRATGRDTILQSYWDDVRVYVPYGQRRFVKDKGLLADLEEHSANRIFPEDLPALRGKAVVLFRPMMARDLGTQSALEGAALNYSMWQGYLQDGYTRRVVDWLEEPGIPWETIDTSGACVGGGPAALFDRDRTEEAGANPLVRNRTVRRVFRQRRAKTRWRLLGRLSIGLV